MRNIKEYKDFQKVNEMFSSSEEYHDLLDKCNTNEYFKEMLYDLTDDKLCRVSIHPSIVDENGRNIESSQSSDPNFDLNYYIETRIIISIGSINIDSRLAVTNIIGGYEKLKELGHKIKTITDSVDTLERRVKDDGLFISGIETRSIASGVAIIVVIKGGIIDKNNLESAYDKYKHLFGPNYQKGINLINNYYEKREIVPELDINENGDGTYMVGFFVGEIIEIIVIATYYSGEDRMHLDRSEIDRSINEYLFERENNV